MSGEQELSSEERLLRAIFGEKAKDVRDTSVRMNGSSTGKVVDVRIYTREQGHELKAGVLMQIKIFVAEMRKIGVGDKLAGRHGNKGVVSRVLPVEDMPFMADGTPIDIILSPMGVPSRMNLGQLFETHLGMAARALGYKVATPSFNGVPDEVISDELEKAGYARDGRVQLYDGLTGEPFNERTSVGVMHMLKLHHMVEDKIHARSTGPYTMVTQQPLGGKAQNGGQRFGEMEVWALEAYGAATTLQEMLTIKSDDVYGRAKAYESIIKHEPIEGPKLPEGFNVLVKELQGLGLKVDLLDHGESADAGDVIEKTSREIEKDKDDQSIYDQHKKDTAPTIVDLDDEEAVQMMAEEGIEITDGDESEDLDESPAEEERSSNMAWMDNFISASDFDSIRLSVASRDDILNWSYGEVTKPETINYRTQKPERDGLFCERIFGPTKDINPHDSKLKGVRSREAAVDKEGNLVTKSITRRERMGHITLAAPVAHIWFMRGIPSALSLLLDITVKNIEKVVYFATYLMTEVKEDEIAKTLATLESQTKAAREAIEIRYTNEAKAEGADVKALAEARTKELEELESDYQSRKSML